MHRTNRTVRRITTEIHRYALISTSLRAHRYRHTAWAKLRQKEAIEAATRSVFESDLPLIYGSSFGW